MFTKQKLIDDIQVIKPELESLIKLISDFDQPALEDKLGYFFESLMGKISIQISFAEDIFTRKQLGLSIEELIEKLEDESITVFYQLG